MHPRSLKILSKEGTSFLIKLILLSCGGNIEKEPRTFDEAWNCEDPVYQEKWRMAIKKEYSDMEDRKVWNVIRKEDVPKDRRCIKCKTIVQ